MPGPPASDASLAWRPEVLVIGGGSTGAGVVPRRRHAGIQGRSWSERRDLADGTTGRYHGLLHSGGRYAGSTTRPPRNASARTSSSGGSPPTASRTPAACSSTTPGTTRPSATRSSAVAAPPACRCEEIPVAEALAREPRLDPGISRAFRRPRRRRSIPGSSFGAARSARGARRADPALPPGRRARARGRRVTGAVARIDLARGDPIHPGCRERGGRVGGADRRAGRPPVVLPGKGIMIAMNHRLVNTVVNRCKPPGGRRHHRPHPHGLRDRHDRLPGRRSGPPSKGARPRSTHMLDEGETRCPASRRARALRVWAGVPPALRRSRTMFLAPREAGRRRHPRHYPRPMP